MTEPITFKVVLFQTSRSFSLFIFTYSHRSLCLCSETSQKTDEFRSVAIAFGIIFIRVSERNDNFSSCFRSAVLQIVAVQCFVVILEIVSNVDLFMRRA